MLKPVKRQSLSDAVFEQLRDQIIGGAIEPGVELPAERALCEKLGVNRGALREALKRLEQARLVSIQHGGSTRVLNFRETAGMDLLSQILLGPGGNLDLVVARSVIEMRSALAPDIARLAAERASAEQVDRIDAVVAEMAAAEGDLPLLQTAALKFWTLLVESSGNVAYRLAFNTMSQVYRQLFDLLTSTLGAELTYLAGYRAVAKAIRAKDAAKAERRARDVVRRGGAALLEVVQTIEALGNKERSR